MKQKYVVFTMNSEKFAVEINKVREICLPTKITPIPATPKHIMGLMLERNVAVSIIDLKAKLNIARKEEYEDRVIIMMTFEETREELKMHKTYGFMVNEVLSIIEIDDSEIDVPNPFIKNDKEYISGFIKENGSIIIVLNTDKIL